MLELGYWPGETTVHWEFRLHNRPSFGGSADENNIWFIIFEFPLTKLRKNRILNQSDTEGVCQ